jgi:hypothetical protein
MDKQELRLRKELHLLTGEHSWEYVGFNVPGLGADEVYECRICGVIKNVRGPGY